MSCLQGVIRYDNLAILPTTPFSEQSTVSCLQGVIADDTLLGVAYRVLFIRRYSLPVACLHDVIRDDNLLGAASRVLFTRWYSPPQTPEQSTVSWLQGLTRYDNLLGAAYHVLFTGFYLLPQTSEQPHRVLCTGVICYHKPLNSLTVSSVLVLFAITNL